ncbi:MAG: glutamate--cysteine ligase [Burkholderiaceae bacterium]|nr:glutamate--cysteine ligase [Burkholderiaceae bacterium]
MDRIFDRLDALSPEVLRGLQRGVEKEGLRARPDGMLSDRPHPEALGAPLTNPHVTTDFSESQLELITGVHGDADACVEELTQIHQFVQRQLDDEVIWASSMPCRLPADDEIPLGKYGSSNLARMKTVYRKGLSYRYGSRMQTISGVHYNFSLPDAAWQLLQQRDGSTADPVAYRNDAYFALIRNFRRHSWLLLYLFGASPAASRSFVTHTARGLSELEACTLFLPRGTTLRMGPLGYQSDAQATLGVSYNSLETYSRRLCRALREPYPAYEAVGVRDGDDYHQMNTTLLQIENEFYGTIRPKRSVHRGERPLHAIGEGGVEYVEVRCMDVDPFSPVGIAPSTMRFLDVFLLHCLLAESPPDTPEEIKAIARNQYLTAERGRDPAMRLTRGESEVALPQWGLELLDSLAPVAAALDAARSADPRAGNIGPGPSAAPHRDTLARARAALADPALTLSAMVLQEMAVGYENSHLRFALAQSLRHRALLLDTELPPAQMGRLRRIAAESVAERIAVEQADTVPFETYRQQYLAQRLIGGAAGNSADAEAPCQ